MIPCQSASMGAIVITGASSGIGEACALHLDRLGFRVFAGVRREVDGTALRQKAFSDQLTPILLDVTDAPSILTARDVVESATKASGLIGLVNNAGIAVAGPLEFLPLTELRRQLEVNVIGQVAVSQALLPLLRRGHGRIINIGSLGGRITMPFNGPYHASKFALEALNDCMRMELRPWDIPISLIEPGVITTPLWEKSLDAVQNIFRDFPQEAHDFYGLTIPAVCIVAAKVSNRGTSVEDVVKIVVRALTVAKPKTRYRVGRGVTLALVFAKLPDRLRDFLITRLLPTYT